MITEERLKELESFRDEATPGRMTAAYSRADNGDYVVCSDIGYAVARMAVDENYDHCPKEWIANNARFTAHAFNAVPELIAEVRRLRAAPAWHDRPTGPGLWMKRSGTVVMVVPHDMGQRHIEQWPGGRVYGPIPADKEGTETCQDAQ